MSCIVCSLPDLESWQCPPEPADKPAELGRVSPLERRRVVELGVALGRRVRLQLADTSHPILIAMELLFMKRVWQVPRNKIEVPILPNWKTDF